MLSRFGAYLLGIPAPDCIFHRYHQYRWRGFFPLPGVSSVRRRGEGSITIRSRHKGESFTTSGVHPTRWAPFLFLPTFSMSPHVPAATNPQAKEAPCPGLGGGVEAHQVGRLGSDPQR